MQTPVFPVSLYAREHVYVNSSKLSETQYTYIKSWLIGTTTDSFTDVDVEHFNRE